MSAFWTRLSAHLKYCGRNATFLMLMLVGLFILLFLTAIICAARLHKHLLPALPAIFSFAMALVGVVIHRARASRRERLHSWPLSRDEPRVAWSKLVKHRNR